MRSRSPASSGRRRSSAGARRRGAARGRGAGLPLGFLHDVYEVGDFEAQVAQLRAAGVRFIMEPCEIEAAFGRRKIAFFETPDGMRTEVMQIITAAEPS